MESVEVIGIEQKGGKVAGRRGNEDRGYRRLRARRWTRSAGGIWSRSARERSAPGWRIGGEMQVGALHTQENCSKEETRISQLESTCEVVIQEGLALASRRLTYNQ